MYFSLKNEKENENENQFEALTMEIKFTCRGAPVQAEGQLPDKRWFYFRSRHAHWSFTIADTIKAAVNGDKSVFAVIAQYGNNEEASWMELQKAKDIIKKCLAVYKVSKYGDTVAGQ